ncbi:hypothetical protein BDR26DRAFT_326907 [Obelidium mucronatum]|nr:hypothetical protein BDR26DRAFT_326907 [Obelidium mucronatum]
MTAIVATVVVVLAAYSSAMVIPRSLTSSTDFPISEPDIYTSSQLVTLSSTGYSNTACQLPASLGLIGADHVVAINSKQLVSFDTRSSTCGMCISISTSDTLEPILAIVVDDCPNCPSNSIGISPTIYQKLIETVCTSKVGVIPTMSLAWSQSSTTFSSIQLYGLPFAITHVSASWDKFSIREALKASWYPLVMPPNQKSLGYWFPSSGIPPSFLESGPIALKVHLRNGTTLITTSQSVNFGQNSGDVDVGLWFCPGQSPVISHSASSSSFLRRDDLSLADAVVQEVIDYGV